VHGHFTTSFVKVFIYLFHAPFSANPSPRFAANRLSEFRAGFDIREEYSPRPFFRLP